MEPHAFQRSLLLFGRRLQHGEECAFCAPVQRFVGNLEIGIGVFAFRAGEVEFPAVLAHDGIDEAGRVPGDGLLSSPVRLPCTGSLDDHQIAPLERAVLEVDLPDGKLGDVRLRLQDRELLGAVADAGADDVPVLVGEP